MKNEGQVLVPGTPFYISKTMIASALTVLLPHIPVVKDFIRENPETTLSIAGILFGVLRVVTTKKLDFKIKF
jgi:hypothetical protein